MSLVFRSCVPWLLIGPPIGTGTQHDTELTHKLKQCSATAAKALETSG